MDAEELVPELIHGLDAVRAEAGVIGVLGDVTDPGDPAAA